MIRCFALRIGLFGALFPGLALVLAMVLLPDLASAQTNLDQGKSASQIFASACAECHKAAHGLAHGRNSAALVDFLGEHYTTNRDQAAALAAYVLGGSGASPIGAAPQSRGQKPKAEHASISTEETKPGKPLPKPAAKPEDGKPATNTNLRRPAREAAKPKDDTTTGSQPSIAAPEPGPPARSATINRNRRKDMNVQPPPLPEPAAARASPAAIEPSLAETPDQETAPVQAPSAVAPTNAASGESGEDVPVPRDNIPD